MEVDQQITLARRVQVLLAEVFQVQPEEIQPGLAFGDLPQWDSMGHMDVMMSLEERFGVVIDTEAIATLTSVPAICAYLEQQGYA